MHQYQTIPPRVGDDVFSAGSRERTVLDYLLTFKKYRDMDRTLLCDIIEDVICAR